MASEGGFRSRIKELRYVTAAELKANPKNWRIHPKQQTTALRQVLTSVGFVDALLARELPDGTLELLDGHLRAEVSGEQSVPVLVCELTDAEADAVLATFDPLTQMAKADRELLSELLSGINLDGIDDALKSAAKVNGIKLDVPEEVEINVEACYQILIECENEEQQLELLEKFETEGLKCRALIS